MSEREVVLLEHAFVLHHRPYRNSSLLIDCLTLQHGRVGLVGQGARRAKSGNRAYLQPFSKVMVSWVRRGELGRLTHVEGDGYMPPLTGNALMAGFYLNDLLLRLVSRGDSNPEIFDAYRNCLNRLATGVQVARAVRMFELCLLSALGYRVELERDVRTGEALRPELTYAFEFESGPSVSSADRGEEYLGAQLISLRDGVLDDQDSLRAAKRLLGKILRSYLGERPLNSRNVLREMAGRGFGRDLATTKQ